VLLLAHLLEGSVYGPDEVRELARVYREVIAALSLKSAAARQNAAKTILRVAGEQVDFDPVKLRDQAMAELQR
jgi:hypothetical protein